MPSHRDKIGLRKLVLAMGLAVLLHALAQPVRAEVRVSGRADALTVETREASVVEILAALRASFNLHYRTSGVLDRTITGTYTGSLKRVIARLLEGHNYVLRSSAGGGELIVFGPAAAGGNGAAPGRQVAVVAEPRELPAQSPSPAVPARDAVTQVGQPIGPPLPNTNGVPLAVPDVSPLSPSVPTPTPDSSLIAPPNAVTTKGLAPPLPESAPQQRPPGLLPGWKG